VSIAIPPFSVGGYTPGDVRSWIEFEFWSVQSRGARTYLSWTRNPQSFAHTVAGRGHDLEECFAGAQRGELVGRDGPGAVAIDELIAPNRGRMSGEAYVQSRQTRGRP